MRALALQHAPSTLVPAPYHDAAKTTMATADIVSPGSKLVVRQERGWSRTVPKSDLADLRVAREECMAKI